MASIIENLNSVITTKNQLNTILKENGQPGSDVFSEYPEQFRAAIVGAGTNEEAVNSYISAYLDTYNYINSDSLSAYNFIDADELSAMGYVTASDIPEVDLSSYVTYDYLSAQGYVTNVPVIDENIVPKEGNAYTLGSATYMYYRAYTGRIAGDGSGLWVDTGTNHRYYLGSTAIRPYTDNQYSLGTNDYQWAYTYTKNLILDGTDIQDLINSSECPTYSYIADNYLSLHGDRVMDGTLTLGNAVPAYIGTERSWKIYEGGSGSGAYIALQNTVNNKTFFVRSESSQNLVQIQASGSTASKHTLTSSLQGSYVNCYHYIKGIGNYTANNDAVPGTNDVASVFNNTYAYIMSYISSSGGTTTSGGMHVGTAVHDRTSYTVTATVDTFETDGNGDPVVGTCICIKLTSITGTNPSTLYPIKFIVNGKENPRWYGNAAVDANGRNWYRDMNDGLNRCWYWMWDGSYWVWQGLSEERDTTYSAMTDSEAYTGTSTTARLIKPVTLATYYVAKSCFTFDSTTNTLTITVS